MSDVAKGLCAVRFIIYISRTYRERKCTALLYLVPYYGVRSYLQGPRPRDFSDFSHDSIFSFVLVVGRCVRAGPGGFRGLVLLERKLSGAMSFFTHATHPTSTKLTARCCRAAQATDECR